MISLRERVFIGEQKICYPDCDGKDLRAWHLLGWDGATLVATCRVLPPGVKFDEVAIGRVVTAPEVRGRGLGRAMMVEALRRVRAELGPVPVRISAQLYLEKFYRDLGFVTVSEPYDEEGVAHLLMLFEPRLLASP